MARKYQTDSVKVMPGDVVVDVGANIGEFTAAIHETARQCFAFEPDPVAYKCLEANAQKLGNVEPRNVALSDKSGEMTFYLASKTADSSLVEPTVPYEKSIVNARRLDDVFPSLGVEAIDFLKVEAEGWEPEVLKGGEAILTTKVRKIAVDGGPERRGQPPPRTRAMLWRPVSVGPHRIRSR
jgi:FkbM family methyltransferase